ncbi:topoisomerase DNA-binding C4 zinc finger domain-containing protein [archaeon]|nr:topoisomerase DNA-binding C4 zinc finger domain-containing protein [archaeon]
MYDLIVKRTLSSFGTHSTRETLNVEIEIKKEPFVTKGTRTIEPGWQAYYQPYLFIEEKELPPFKENQKIKIKKINLLSKETQPPKRYTPASIIKELEKRNLGTKSTRAAIIDALYQRNYIIENSLQVTGLGLKTIETLDKYSPEILDEELTKEIEVDLEKIREKKEKPKEVIDRAEKFLTKILTKFKKHEKNIGKNLLGALKETRDKASIVGKCDVCKKGDLRILYSRRFKSYFVACSAYPKCKTTHSLTRGLPKPTDKKCESCGFPLVQIIRQGTRPFNYCINKKCPQKLEWMKKNKDKVEAFKKQNQDQKSQK